MKDCLDTCFELVWKTALHATTDTEMTARIQGIKSQMHSFKFLFSLILSELILRHSDKLCQTLQQAKLSSVEGHSVAMLTMRTLETMSTDKTLTCSGRRLRR